MLRRASALVAGLAACLAATATAPTAFAQTARPAVPTGLTATAADGKIVLDWRDHAGLVSGDRYQVYQLNSSGRYAMIANGPSQSTYTVSGLTNGRSYSFRVSAGGSTRRSSSVRYSHWTSPVSATPKPAPKPAPAPPATKADPIAPLPLGSMFPSSYFHKRIPASPSVSSSSSTWVKRILDDGKPSTLVLNDWQYPQYEATNSDPLYSVTVTKYKGPQGSGKLRLPAGAKPAPAADANMGITNRASNEYWGLYGVESINHSTRTIRARGGGVEPFNGDGAFYGESSLRMATKMGIVTVEDLQAGQINHALMVTVYCSTGAVNGAGKTRQCSSVGKPSGPPNGSHLQLQITDAELAAFPAWKRTILRAMRDYGMYVAETGGGFLKTDYASGTAPGTKWQNWLKQNDSQPGVDAGRRTLDFVSGVNWRSRLRVVTP